MIDRKRIVVLGSSRGIGRSCADRLHDDGHLVIGVSRTLAEGASFKQVALDLSSEDTENLLEDLIDQSDPDVLVFSIGQNITDDILSVRPSATLRLFQTNTLSALLAIKVLASKPSKKSRGIVLISSVHARGKHDRLSYSISKAALESIMHSAYKELMKGGVRINCIRPGPTETDMLTKAFPLGSLERKQYLAEVPSGRFSKALEVAAAVRFLISSSAENVTGQTITVSGGY